VLAFQPLLHDLHVQHAEEAAAEAEAQGVGADGLEGEGRVVELQLLQRVAQVRNLRGRAGEKVREDHLLR